MWKAKDCLTNVTNVFFRPIKLVVAKCWDPNPKGYFTIPRTEPVRPIDPGAWVAHTAAIRGEGFPPRPPSATTITSTSSSLASTLPDTESEFFICHAHCLTNTWKLISCLLY